MNCLVAAVAFAGNGIFDAPSFDDYKKLSTSEHRAYRRAMSAVGGSQFLHVTLGEGIHQSTRYHGPSFYATEAGRAELQAISSRILNLTEKYGTVFFVGRSGAGIKAYLEGVASRSSAAAPSMFKELPFSCNDPYFLTKDQKLGLRKHFEANGLSPEKIVSSSKPILFMDFVYTGTGVNTMMKLLYEWAAESGIGAAAMKSKIGFFGAFPPRMLAYNNMLKIDHDTRKEGAPIDMSEENVQRWARERSLPNGGHMKHSWAAEVFEMRISDQFYEYAGTLTEHANQSFKPEYWNTAVDRDQKPTFKGNHDKVPYLELYYLMSEGRKESAEMSSKAKCEVPLLYK